MTRALTSGQEKLLQSDPVRLAFLYEAEYDNDTVRAWTGFEELKFDSDGDGNDETFLPVADFASFDGIEESEGVQTSGFQVSLIGVPYDDDDVLEDALREDYHGRDSKLWLAILKEDFKPKDDPIMLNQGFQDKHTVSDDGSELTVKVQIQNPMKNLRGKATLHYTSEDQKTLHSGDTFFDQVENIQEKTENWGSNLNP